MKPTVVYMLSGGRLGNQLLRFLHLIAWSKQNNNICRILNINFWQYANLFSVWKHNPLCQYPVDAFPFQLLNSFPKLFLSNSISHGRIRQLHHFAHRVADRFPGIQSISSERIVDGRDEVIQVINLDDPHLTGRLSNHPITLLGGWRMEAWNALSVHQEFVRSLFHFREDHLATALKVLAPIRQRKTMIIGVLLRQDDYRSWRGGKYYFDTPTYAKFLTDSLSVFSDKSVEFLVVSDEKQDKASFQGLDVTLGSGYAVGNGHFMENLVELSLCDLIISPPSTFAGLAAFLGDVPLLPLCSVNQLPDKRDILEKNIFDARHHMHFSTAIK